MVEYLLIGSALGAITGLVHGIYIYRLRAHFLSANDPAKSRKAGIYYGLWTFVLWTTFGSYVLGFWLLGIVAWSSVRLLSLGRSKWPA